MKTILITTISRSSFLLNYLFKGHGLNPGSYSGGGGNTYGSDHYKTLANYAAPGEGLGSYGGDQQVLDSHQELKDSDGGDYHHGVSVVSLGNQQKGPTFDLTKHGGGGHYGLFGGSFIDSGKYASGGNEGHHVGGYGHYSAGNHDEDAALLAAALSGGHGEELYHH
ncbi:hypothetical protein HHI36_018319 [Cryptolaemus montrouzieri]|uniref:Uncharacterized protein n=1 Tax=Cryptolaemus montrouzieri TaxID=559131 RepID=A0ABD2P003_9CUCU